MVIGHILVERSESVTLKQYHGNIGLIRWACKKEMKETKTMDVIKGRVTKADMKASKEYEVTALDIANSYSYSAARNCPICRCLQRHGFHNVEFEHGSETRANFTYLWIEGYKYRIDRNAANITGKRANRQLLANGYDPNDLPEDFDADTLECWLPKQSLAPFKFTLTPVG